MWVFDHGFWVSYFIVGIPLSFLIDYGINALSGKPEWIWQTWYRLYKEHQRLYPKESSRDEDS